MVKVILGDKIVCANEWQHVVYENLWVFGMARLKSQGKVPDCKDGWNDFIQW